MRTLKIIIIALLLPIGFAGGYIAGSRLATDAIQLDAEAKASAERAARLQQRIIEELEGRYYRRIDPGKLEKSSIDGMLESLDDPYTDYLTPEEVKLLAEHTEGRYSGIGAVLEKKEERLVITRVFEGSPAAHAGLRAGDRIVSVDGKGTADVSLEANIARIKGEAGSSVRLVVQSADGSARRSLNITRREISIPITDSRVETAPDGTKVGYIQLFQFSEGAGEQVQEELRDVQARKVHWIVFDLRDNGGGLLAEAVDVASDFIESGVVTTTEGLHSPKEVLRAEGDPVSQLPLVVLVNEFTASASEIVSGALQDHERAYLLGTKTFGKGLVQNIVGLPGGSALKLTTAIYLTPDGRDINQRGISPDQIVKEDPKTKADEQLQAALRYIARQ